MGRTGVHRLSARCPFCAILAGDGAVRMVVKTDLVAAFFPKEPATLGHTLVVPLKHIPDIWSVDDEYAAALMAVTREVAGAVRSAFEPEGLNIIQSNGEAATQTVDHLHVHVVPRWSGDDIGPIWPSGSSIDDASLDSALARLRATMAGAR
ncbi:HIT domain-containing protein [Mycolicibacterium madagascariense]|nr:HIT domain-containing protein [Mycolicibacterium madagascariense]